MTPEQMKAFGIPDEFHGEQIFKEAPDLPTVFKITRDLNTYKGSAIRVPGPEASEADRKEFTEKLKRHAPTLVALPEKEEEREAALLERLGIPKEAKEYAPPADHGLPEPVIEALRAEAKEEGLTKRQFEKRVARAKAENEKRTKAEGEQQKALKAELGAAFEDRLLLAASAAKKLGLTDAEVEAIKTGKAPVATVRTYLNAAKALGGESGDLGGVEGGTPKRLTPEEMRSRVQEIYRNPAFMDKSHPQHKDLMDRLTEYNRALYPEEK